jgi:group I intron endonuclease
LINTFVTQRWQIHTKVGLYGVRDKRKIPITKAGNMSYKLYRVINSVNQKSYIGITELSLEDRWKIHISDSRDPIYPFHRAIKKYGLEHFSIFLLEESDSREEISSKEDPAIIFYESHITQNGYNVAKGGYGGNLGDEANKKRKQTFASKTKEEKRLSIQKRNEKVVGRTKHNHAGKLSQSRKMAGNKNALGLQHTEEVKKIISLSNGKPKIQKTRELMSQSAKLNNNGSRFLGRRASCLCCKKDWDMGNFTQHIRKFL